MDTSRFEQFSSLMTGAAKSIAKLKAAQMEAFSLSGAHTSCLCRLYEAGSLTQGELTRAVQMDRSQVSRVLRDLAQKGYVSADAQAGYKRRYALTPTGLETAARVETVCLLSKLNVKHHIEVEITMDELDLTAAESKATYDEIKAYVLEKFGFKVSQLYIAQIKRKCGIIERKNYNQSKKEDAKVPKCPPEKEAAIMDALKHFQMIP